MVSVSSSAIGRSTHARAILGPELHDRLPNTKVLLVGAGGIGCELLKNIVLAGFGKITLLDLDTIDLSNLNRQFLFKKKDVKQSKAMVAARTASAFNPNVHINPIHGNIKDPQFDLAWFKSFDIVLNALDNLDARRHVNKMCMAGNVPLVESGTAGYLGQVQPLLKDRTECFDCIPKQTPKTFPVCTIRSTPSQPIHCIVWAKSYLMSQLFGEDEDSAGELDEALKHGENAQEIDTLRKEAQAFKAVRAALRSSGQSADAARLAFQKVFNADVRNLLSMEDMWRFRDKPIPLDFDAIKEDRFILRGAVASAVALTANGVSNGATVNGSSSSGAGTSNGKLKDQRALSLRDSWEMFVQSTDRLAARLSAGETISFDKDDDDTLDFVTAAANLRSVAYGIPGKSRWEVKEMAGNIIPAIATTNAIVSGLIALQALHMLRGAHDKLRNVHIQFKPAVPLSAIALSAPALTCGVCRDAYALLQCDPARTTLGEVVSAFVGDGRDVSTYEGQRLLSDPDFDDNLERTFESLNVTKGAFLNIVDEEGEYEAVSLAIAPLPPNHHADGPTMILPSPLPQPAKKPPKPKAASEPATPPPRARSLKRSAPDDDEVELAEGPAKRVKTAEQGSPSKRRKLEEDGLVVLEKEDEEMEDDIIVLD